MDFIEIDQDPDMTDSDMMDVIKEKIGEGWSLSDRKYDMYTLINTWVFERV